MKRTDDIRAALREAAEALQEFGNTAQAGRLRGLARRMRTIDVDDTVACVGRYDGRWYTYCNLRRGNETCDHLGMPDCPLSRGPIVVRRAR